MWKIYYATILFMIKNKIILFDLDGTLIDSTEAILESFNVAFESFGVDVPSDEMIKSLIGYPLDKMFTLMGIDASDIEKYVRAYKEHYRKISSQKTVLLPHAKEAVELASKIAHLGVVTTKTSQYSRELLEHLGLMKYFDLLIGREDVVNPKPDPEPIKKALAKLPKVTHGIWMIGDTCMDMDAAYAANIDSIAVLCGYADKQTLEKCSSLILENAFEAIQKITLL